jgi:hypothetical protein
MATINNGMTLWARTGTLTVAASPLLSGWIDTQGFTQVIPWFSFAGGTSVHSIQGSFDASTIDALFVYGAPTSGTVFTVLSPFIRWSTVQTVATATTAEVFLQSRA